MRDGEVSKLVERTKRGDAKAYASLVRRYQTPVYNLMLRMTRCSETALDLAQDTFVRAYERIEFCDAERDFFPWLYTLGMNVARDHLRRRKRQAGKLQSLDETADDSRALIDMDDQYAQASDRDSVNQALAQLPDDMREALVMRFREEFSYQEIADALHIGLSNAKMKVHRALDLLRKVMAKEECS